MKCDQVGCIQTNMTIVTLMTNQCVNYMYLGVVNSSRLRNNSGCCSLVTPEHSVVGNPPPVYMPAHSTPKRGQLF